jgi:pimeloyl-ACP methyl ester carboxylesterase
MHLPHDFVPPVPRTRTTVASADGTRIAVEVHGPDDAPTVVLGHGWTCSAGFWGRVLHRLGDEVRAVVYDQRGHGRSEHVPRSACTTTALVDDLEAVLLATVPDGERAVVAGHSMGAMALVALAGERPAVLRDKVCAALLASTGVGRLVDEARVVPHPGPLRAVAKAMTQRGMSDARLLTMLPRWGRRVAVSHITLSPAADRHERAYCTDVVLACPPHTRAGFARMLAGLDLGNHLRALDVPALVLCGTQDRLTPPRHSHQITAALPQSLGLVELAGIGHMTPVQSPDAVADAVRRLVRDHHVSAAAVTA